MAVRDAAEARHLSERKLHRHLSLEGTWYLKLLDKAWFKRAL